MSIRDYLLPAIKGFNYDKYWNRRDKIFEKKTPKILKMYYLFICAGWMPKMELILIY